MGVLPKSGAQDPFFLQGDRVLLSGGYIPEMQAVPAPGQEPVRIVRIEHCALIRRLRVDRGLKDQLAIAVKDLQIAAGIRVGDPEGIAVDESEEGPVPADRHMVQDIMIPQAGGLQAQVCRVKGRDAKAAGHHSQAPVLRDPQLSLCVQIVLLPLLGEDQS